ncbi:adenylate/guanylate cyclase domain-containing protein [Leptospira biflexa]|jgi:class 3 adenylate cyclase|uniref:Putative adenylate/guanylate cyclase n=1 Tax=Leptospira biflexa serovar Patoc (strain Patoc 1 / ATCC 23582 / Paris) TaxID=456481 RepID=B0SPK6_LEPBP|nr:adenylate/guanylate cyclase domain-containing protein [Leptospira biflexa]ABZ95413.1 Adenylate cyclase related protein [Leptospira biflexa serovar Patoc strain 'Patoc 1 (Ames)']ABZ99112.1 Putative adenylate/guanylate cyclase [Leptospira biflexa serovar Patoc strain 'Patoc 1 (Paris)']TGM35730.1 adenylate/guanylate cyclase domain-containing protein [Leptospira biflexa]TGM37100.1 adenylate/guanylate cyclase domain-containing protein [Leptospira biflexa]TGM46643.1 adenylate/guanylate cyclase do
MDINKVLEEEKAKYEELEVLYQNIIDHSTEIENELLENNKKIQMYLDRMRRYLSPQLYEMITGAEVETSISHQRRKLTIFFSDIVGFTTITDSIEPEILSDCLNKYLDVMSSIAIKYGGTIDKFIGDAIMIFFGAPSFENDKAHALNCVKMAIEMRDSLPALDEYWRKSGINHNLTCRIGINTGYVTVGNFGTNERMDYTIIGGPVNVASRLENASNAGEILISNATKSLIDEFIETIPKGEVLVKGVHTPIETFQVIGLKNDQEKKENPFVKFDGEGFLLKPLHFDKLSTNPEERRLMQNALEKALAALK